MAAQFSEGDLESDHISKTISLLITVTALKAMRVVMGPEAMRAMLRNAQVAVNMRRMV